MSLGKSEETMSFHNLICTLAEQGNVGVGWDCVEIWWLGCVMRDGKRVCKEGEVDGLQAGLIEGTAYTLIRTKLAHKHLNSTFQL